MFISLSADMIKKKTKKQTTHTLTPGKMLNGERKAIVHERGIAPQCQYSFTQTSVLQQNTTLPSLGEH